MFSVDKIYFYILNLLFFIMKNLKKYIEKIYILLFGIMELKVFIKAEGAK